MTQGFVVVQFSITVLFGSLVQNTFEDLEDSGCLKMNEDSVEPMMLGSIASQYYLKYMTVSMFGSNIGPDTSLEVKTPTYSRYNFHFHPFLSNVSLHLFFVAGFPSHTVWFFRI